MNLPKCYREYYFSKLTQLYSIYYAIQIYKQTHQESNYRLVRLKGKCLQLTYTSKQHGQILNHFGENKHEEESIVYGVFKECFFPSNTEDPAIQDVGFRAKTDT